MKDAILINAEKMDGSLLLILLMLLDFRARLHLRCTLAGNDITIKDTFI